MEKNNKNRNKNSKPHIYKAREKVLVRDKKENKYEKPYKGPYQITKVQKNGTVTLLWGALKECINIIWIKPYHKQ